MIARLAITVSGCTLAVGLLAGQTPQTSAPAPTSAAQLKAGPASILGRVVESGSTTGIANAVVTLSGPSLGPPSAMFSNGVAGGARRVMTDGQGQFVFRDLPAGSYSLDGRATGYVDALYGPPATFPRPSGFASAVVLTDADRPLALTFPLQRLGGISGRVVDEAGEPMVGTTITLYSRRSEWGVASTTVATRATTDDRGLYHADVPPGDYVVALNAVTTTVPAAAVDGFQQAFREGGPAQQAYMKDVVANGSLLPRGVGTRVGSFLVSQFGMQNTWAVPPLYMRDGRWFVYPTTYHPSSATGASASVVTVSSGEEKSGIDLSVRSVVARRVTGRVLGPAGPAAGMALRLISPDNDLSSVIWSVSADAPQALTDAKGDFTFIGVAPGPYVVRVLRGDPTSMSDPVLWSADAIVVGADTDLTNLTVTLQPGAPIAGRLVVEGATSPPAAVLKAMSIKPTPLFGTPSALMAIVGWVVHPDDNGRFQTGQMVMGPYTMAITGLPAGWVVKTVTVNGRDAIDKPFELTSAGIADVVVTISDKVSTLTGIVRDANGQPEPDATVAVCRVDRGLWPPPGTASRRIQTALVRRDGRYNFIGLPPGEYFVVATTWAVDFSDARVRSTFMADAVRVTIGDGETRALDVRATVKR